MCLAVYLGCDAELPPSGGEAGSLGHELASWTPEPLAHHGLVYYLGRIGSHSLECSCLLSEDVWWSDGGLRWQPDELFDSAPHDPHLELQKLCKTAIEIAGNQAVTLYCDDQGGETWSWSRTDDERCERRMISAQGIVSGAMLFADEQGWPLRSITVVPSSTQGR